MAETSTTTNENKAKKNIIVLFDGTCNGYYTNTNIHRLASNLSMQLPNKTLDSIDTKIAYYQGIGNGGGILYYMWNACFAFDLNVKVEEAYKFICHEYDPEKENKVWIFGFSRGAYSARILSQMIDKVGVLDRSKYCTDEDTRQQGFSLWSVFMQMLNILVKILSYLHIIGMPMAYFFLSMVQIYISHSTHPYSAEFEEDITTATFLRRAILQRYDFNRDFYMAKVGIYAKKFKYFIRNIKKYRDISCAILQQTAQEYLVEFRQKSHPNSDGCVFFLGLFDTVGSVGVPSIDVDKGELVPEFYYSDDEKTLRDGIPHVYHAMAAYEAWLLFKPLEIPYGTQMWFPGVHIDVGGCLGVNPISDATYNWMIGHINTALQSDNQLKDSNNSISECDKIVANGFNPINTIPTILHFITKYIFPFLDSISPYTTFDITRLAIRDINISTDSTDLLQTSIYKEIHEICDTNVYWNVAVNHLNRKIDDIKNNHENKKNIDGNKNNGNGQVIKKNG